MDFQHLAGPRTVGIDMKYDVLLCITYRLSREK